MLLGEQPEPLKPDLLITDSKASIWPDATIDLSRLDATELLLFDSSPDGNQAELEEEKMAEEDEAV